MSDLPFKPTRARQRRDLQRPADAGWRQELHDIIFEADSPAGRWFDIGLLIAILASIFLVAVETVPEYEDWRNLFIRCEQILAGLFAVEYVMRLMTVRKPMKYALSFWGIIDLLSFLPSFITPFIGGSSASFVTLRAIRLLRVFRVLKLWRMMDDADELASAVWRSRNKIIVFLAVVLVAVTISGTLMYHIEHVSDMDAGGQFTSIPQAMYWAIVTMTTVGYGDIVPKTTLGKFISAALILLGYSLIIVPSTFVSAEIIQKTQTPDAHPCPHCNVSGHRADATYCYRCGDRLVR
ncbi:Cyclic nucleotide-gated potassium channel [Rubripirellula lacrimiformis]|uniref:Cyclic nucleotide-gated potassium channel n=1 Tax=Rubripirellula lacrimiformis TaxID=1930273 RepID=A0A517NA67_9BACT|nr:ion transporter [Rubripirellula lacrimiformis]QDT04020.1 Cyclic nucleotide-gated potassium channel [Rubripirellula lacrimiformis]